MAYDNTDSGALFKNEKKLPDDNRPNYTGNINVGGVNKRLAAWMKTDRNGKPYMSLKVTDPQERQPPDTTTRPEPDRPLDGGGKLDDEIPF